MSEEATAAALVHQLESGNMNKPGLRLKESVPRILPALAQTYYGPEGCRTSPLEREFKTPVLFPGFDQSALTVQEAAGLAVNTVLSQDLAPAVEDHYHNGPLRLICWSEVRMLTIQSTQVLHISSKTFAGSLSISKIS